MASANANDPRRPWRGAGRPSATAPSRAGAEPWDAARERHAAAARQEDPDVRGRFASREDAGGEADGDGEPAAGARGKDPYVQALGWLARRELSTAQVRARLARRGVESEAVEAAIARLAQERALDDRRVALAYTRSAVSLKRRGRTRVRRELVALGIAPALADEAVREVFGDMDEAALLDQALARRWPGNRPLTRPDQQRLYRALLRQGFASSAIIAALRARRVEIDGED